ncbi:ABC transporter ATP-binding protein [Thermonema rossianum]|uniref:ABC transporter ATP-binding protein n=1 Tax=Thermonema rossianum TaxID=55505 RepID=UPI00056EDA30|nr:ABC transporter ATP-binding protein [Thermonema rossianum]
MSEEKQAQSGNVFDWYIAKRLFAFAKPYKGVFWAVVALTLTLAVLGPVRPYLVQYTVDHYMEAGQYEGLLWMVLLMLLVLALQTAAQYLHTYWAAWLGQSIIRDIRVRLYHHILRLRLSFFDKTPIGRLVTRVVSDVQTLSDVFSQGLAAMIADVLQLLAILAVMFYTDWRLTLVSLSMLPLLLLSTYIFKEKIKVAFKEVRNAVANLNAFVQEHITGMNIVQIFGSEEHEFEKFKKINAEHRRANLKSVLYYSIYFPVAEVIGALGTALLVWYGAGEVVQQEVSLGTLIAFMMYISLFFRPIRLIADRFNILQMGIVSAERIFKLLDNQNMITDSGTYRPESLRGEVVFDDVWFAYNPGEYVLKGISFEVKAGETVAIVGATGAGKTSIINLLNRFYEIERGSILVDGVNIKDYDVEVLRRHIGMVLQDVFLFSGSIRDNITLFNPAITDGQIWEAAEMVGAKAFIERLPGQLDYNVMERGATLSVGQRQLISFIRAMVYHPEIIVLDEATSSVDTETEELIQEAIEKLMKGRTALVIAHRLSTIQHADKIIVLDKGQIVEIGDHEELLKKNGHYARLYRMQYMAARA